MTEKETRQLNPLVMAFVGDSVFTLFVRTRLASASHTKAGGLHKEANKFVSAPAQSYMFCAIENLLTEDEAAIARRAKTRTTTRWQSTLPLPITNAPLRSKRFSGI